MVNICERWTRDKTDDLQYAFFNGVGYESWENIWGIWNGITPRDAEAMRRIAKIERAFAPFLVSPEWEPLYSDASATASIASQWPLRRSDRLDHRQPQRIRHRRPPDGGAAASTACATSICGTAWN